jgi:sugar phosphate isomerase/epimerase
MKICYQIAAPDIKPALDITLYLGTLEHSFMRLSECGYDGAELMICDPTVININELKTLSKRYGLEIPMVCTGEIGHQGGLSYSSLNDDVRNEAINRTKGAVDIACELGAQTNIGRIRGDVIIDAPPGVCRKRSIEAIREIAEYADGKGVLVALEPINSLAINFINTTQEGIDLIKEIECPSLTLMLDIHHMYLEDKDMIQSIYDAKDYVTHVHLADSNRQYPGNCKLDFKEFIDAFKHIEYDGYFGVEVYQRPDQETALERSIQHLKPLL